jgi:leucyl aminopeptidase
MRKLQIIIQQMDENKINENIIINYIKNLVFVSIPQKIKKYEWREWGAKTIDKINNSFSKEDEIEIELSISNSYNRFMFLEGMMVRNFKFKMKKDDKLKPKIKFKVDNKEKFNELLAEITSLNKARYLSSLPANIATIEYIKNYVENNFEGTDVKVSIYDVKELEKLSMGGHLAVGKGSEQKPMTIKLEYIPKQYDKEYIFVGKGLVYDTGGLSLKPTDSMVNMHTDKIGAMNLIGLMDYVAKIKPNKKIVAYLGLAENSIDNKAYRPGDIITMKNGKTVRILNTDAEGRMVLFDNLTLAEDENPNADAIFSIATLTGAAMVQFGVEECPIMGFHNEMKRKIIKLGKQIGEDFVIAKFNRFIMDDIKDDVADLRNIGKKRWMGSQKAGIFLTHALDKLKNKYTHFDIAGVSRSDNGFSYFPKGTTGFGVRTLMKLVKN